MNTWRSSLIIASQSSKRSRIVASIGRDVWPALTTMPLPIPIFHYICPRNTWCVTPLSTIFQLYRRWSVLLVEEIGVPREKEKHIIP